MKIFELLEDTIQFQKNLDRLKSKLLLAGHLCVCDEDAVITIVLGCIYKIYSDPK